MDSIDKHETQTDRHSAAPEANDEIALEKADIIVATDHTPVADDEKTYYSKQSVWLMILFSGLAIGSDG